MTNNRAETELEVSEIVAAKYADEYRYCRHSSKNGDWLAWDATKHVWRKGSEAPLVENIKDICRELSHGRTMGKTSFCYAVLRALQTHEAMRSSLDEWDAFEDGVNTPDGLVFFEDRDADDVPDKLRYCTKSTRVSPKKGEPVLWQKMLNQIFQGDSKKIILVQQIAGTCLCPDSVGRLIVFNGDGQNGKSLLIKVIADIVGDYARKAPSGAFIESRNEHHPTWLAGMERFRMVYSGELRDGSVLDEAFAKAFVTGEKQSARRMNQDFSDYVPQATLIIDTNKKPKLRGVDKGWRRRMLIVPFNWTIPDSEVDPSLSEKLRREYPQILNWMLEGLKQWLLNKRCFDIPESVQTETDSYFKEQDIVLEALTSYRFKRGSGFQTRASVLYTAIKAYAKTQGIDIDGSSERELFSRIKPHMEHLRISHKKQGVMLFYGIGLNQDFRE